MALNARYTKGIEIELGGNATKLKTALDDANRSIKVTQRELKTLKNNLSLEWDAGHFKRAQELAQKAVAETVKKADALKAALAELDKQGEDKSSERYEVIRRELSYAEVAAQKARGELEKLNSVRLDALKKSLEEAAAKLDGLGNKLTVGLTAPLAAAGAASVKYASDTEESMNKVDVAFKGSSASVTRWSENTLRQYGLAQGTALDMAALFGDMATSMGFADSQAADMAKTLVGLGADLASFKNISVDQASNALKSVFTGETESLKNLGVVMTQTNLKAFALAQGFETAYDRMDQAQQVAVRYQYVLQQTKNAQGDFARTADGTANQLRVFQESLKEAAATAGGELLPIITPIIGRLSELIQSFGELDEGTRKLLVNTGLFLATLGPMFKLTGAGTKAIAACVSAYQTLKKTLAGVTTVQAALNAVMMATPAGAIATAVGALVAVLGSFALTSALTSDKQKSLNKQMRDTVSACDEATQSIQKNTDEQLTSLDAFSRLVPRMEELNSKTHRTAEEQEELNTLVSTANGLYPGLIGSIDDATGSYDLNTDALYRNIDALRLKYQIEANDSALAEQTKAQAELTQQLAEAKEHLAEVEGRLSDAQARGAGQDEIDGISWAVERARGTVDDLSGALDAMDAEVEKNLSGAVDLRGQYADLAGGLEDLSQSTGEAVQTAQQLAEAGDKQAQSTRALASETQTLSDAFAEQAKNGTLSLDTVLQLIDAGYAAALTVDKETGAVRLNAEAYTALASAKIDEQIAAVESQRASVNSAIQLKNEAFAAAMTAEGYLDLARAKGIAAQLGADSDMQSLREQSAALEAQAAALAALKGRLGDVVAGSWSGKPAAGGQKTSSGKAAKTEEETRVEAYKKAVADLDYLRDMDEVSEAEYYDRLRVLRDRYLAENSDEWRAATVKLHQFEAAQADAATKAQAAEYQEQLADIQYFRDMALISEADYYDRLRALQSKYLQENSAEWRAVNLDLFAWQQKQQQAAADALSAAEKSRQEQLNALTEQRIAAIKAEQAAEEERLNALIAGINDEIAARRRLRQQESDEDAVVRAQKTLDAAKAQLEYARDEYGRAELQKEVTRAQQALDEAIQSKTDNDWAAAKQAELDALQEQMAQVRDAAQGKIDAAGQWAEAQVARQEAAQRERAAAQEAQRAAQSLAQSADKVLRAATAAATAVSNVTNNQVSITTGQSMLSSGQLARVVEKTIEKLGR